MDEGAAVGLDGDMSEGPQRGGAVFGLIADRVDVEENVSQHGELNAAAKELAAFFGGEQRAEHVRRNGEGSGSGMREKRKEHLWGMRSRTMLTLSRLRGRPIVMSEALKSLSEVTKFHTQGLSRGEEEEREREKPFTA